MSKGGYLTPLRVENVDSKNWKILSKFVWLGSYGDTLTVEEGETTDFATVPWFTQWLIPRTGTWTKAAVIHDKMCNLLNAQREWDMNWHPDGHGTKPEYPAFNSIDTDAVFRKNARDEGTDRVRSELLWVGVRIGALFNAARRTGWLLTFPRFLGDLVAITAVLVGVAYLLGWLVSLV